jgi:hypothetical protein
MDYVWFGFPAWIDDMKLHPFGNPLLTDAERE